MSKAFRMVVVLPAAHSCLASFGIQGSEKLVLVKEAVSEFEGKTKTMDSMLLGLVTLNIPGLSPLPSPPRIVSFSFLFQVSGFYRRSGFINTWFITLYTNKQP